MLCQRGGTAHEGSGAAPGITPAKILREHQDVCEKHEDHREDQHYGVDRHGMLLGRHIRLLSVTDLHTLRDGMQEGLEGQGDLREGNRRRDTPPGNQ